jgi:hypothetical protein
VGNKAKELVRLMSNNKKIEHIPNACDYTTVDINRRSEVNKSDMTELSSLGLDVELLDLKDYFGKNDGPGNRLNEFGGNFIGGGNTYILKQAMKLIF